MLVSTLQFIEKPMYKPKNTTKDYDYLISCLYLQGVAFKKLILNVDI